MRPCALPLTTAAVAAKPSSKGPDSEIEFQEQMIQEREGKIEKIEQGITELNQIFRDLAQIVGEQQDGISAFF